jgi:hypothetical protein
MIFSSAMGWLLLSWCFGFVSLNLLEAAGGLAQAKRTEVHYLLVARGIVMFIARPSPFTTASVMPPVSGGGYTP